MPPAQAERVWAAVIDAGRLADLRPCGLGARDTLRLEAAMRLYGNDMDDQTTVLEAGLGWIVGWQKPDFLGADRLREQKANGLERKLVAFEMQGRAIARHGYPVVLCRPSRRRRHQRDPHAVPQEGDRVCDGAGGADRRRNAARHRDPWAEGTRQVVPEPFYKRPKKPAVR